LLKFFEQSLNNDELKDLIGSMAVLVSRMSADDAIDMFLEAWSFKDVMLLNVVRWTGKSISSLCLFNAYACLFNHTSIVEVFNLKAQNDAGLPFDTVKKTLTEYMASVKGVHEGVTNSAVLEAVAELEQYLSHQTHQK
jgi:hypothetical protein